MPVTFELTATAVRFTTVGDVDHRDALGVFLAGLAAGAAAPVPGGRHLFFDIRASTENRETSELRHTAAAIAAHRPALSGRCAVVAADPLHFGLARMFAVFIGGLGFDATVFRSIEEAERWLGRPAGA